MKAFYWIVCVLAGLVYLAVLSIVLFTGGDKPAVDRNKPWPPVRNQCPNGWTVSGGVTAANGNNTPLYCTLKLPRVANTNQLSIVSSAGGMMTATNNSGAQFSVPRGGPSWKASKSSASVTTFQEASATPVHTSILGSSIDGASGTAFNTGDTGWWIAFQPAEANAQNDWWKSAGLSWS